MISEDRKADLAALAERLAAAWQAAGVMVGPDEAETPRDRPEAYFVQDRMAQIIGAPCTGWKIGATSAKMREIDGHDDIIPGRLFPSITHFGNAKTLSLGYCPNPRVETEFGFRIDATLPLRDDPWTAVEVAPHLTLHPAFEIIGNRFTMPGASAPVLSLMGIADNGGGVAAVFGDAVEDWRGIDYRHHPISFRVDDRPESENFLGEMRCEPTQAVADLANLLAGRGYHLSEGDMVLTGAATVPQPVAKGSRLTADYGALGRLALDFT